MIHDNIYFHNVAELVQEANQEGLRVQRYPEYLRVKINERAQMVSQSPVANVELRFILKSDSVDITLSAIGEEPLTMFVMWGGLQDRNNTYIITQEPQTITLEYPERLKQLDDKHMEGSLYNYKMARLMFEADPITRLYYHGNSNGIISTPQKEDMPAKRLLCYGTSITHGSILNGPHMTYPFLTAHMLGTDVFNLGLSGAAFCENEIADYIANRDDWDIATLSISVNMSNSFSVEEFKERAAYMVNTVAKRNQTKPVFCITLYPHTEDYGIYNDNSLKQADAFRKTLRDIVEAYDGDNVYLVEGTDMLNRIDLLSSDLLHPKELGMIKMAQTLSEAIKKHVD